MKFQSISNVEIAVKEYRGQRVVTFKEPQAGISERIGKGSSKEKTSILLTSPTKFVGLVFSAPRAGHLKPSFS